MVLVMVQFYGISLSLSCFSWVVLHVKNFHTTKPSTKLILKLFLAPKNPFLPPEKHFLSSTPGYSKHVMRETCARTSLSWYISGLRSKVHEQLNISMKQVFIILCTQIGVWEGLENKIENTSKIGINSLENGSTINDSVSIFSHISSHTTLGYFSSILRNIIQLGSIIRVLPVKIIHFWYSQYSRGNIFVRFLMVNLGGTQ